MTSLGGTSETIEGILAVTIVTAATNKKVIVWVHCTEKNRLATLELRG
jgi:hypothetical protein